MAHQGGFVRRSMTLLSLALGPLACMDQATPTEPNVPIPALAIADAAPVLTPGFYWLPPLGQQPARTGTFDDALAPEVEICELAGSACRQIVATYTMIFGPGGETVRLDRGARHYGVNWSTRDFDLRAESRYRIVVRAGREVQLGYADVVALANGRNRRNADATDAGIVVIGRTVPIKFRIDVGIVGDLTISPAQVSLGPGATQQFVATLHDLHGNPMSGLVTWASSNTEVATVSPSGLATAIAAGEATITAMAGPVTQSASLTVSAPRIAEAVSAGFDHSCALAPTGRAYCWGLGSLGRLGTGSSTDQPTPAAVAGGITFANVDAGDVHTCGLTGAGTAYCWGNSANGRLGDGSRLVKLVPTAVAGDLAFRSISAGASHTCGVTTAGVGYCWGDGSYGRLGTGSTTDQPTPAAVSGGLTFVSISAGYFHSCGITTVGRAYCWGDNEFGQLGIGWAAPNHAQPTPNAVETNLTFAAITVSGYQTCALTTTGRAYCWGSGVNGRLGTGSTVNQSTPTPVAISLTFTSITTGYVHGCALEAVTGRAYCWGDATYGQIGTGATVGTLVPTPVAGGLTFAGLSAGYLHTCGVTTGTGQLYCWGSNSSGRLGTGTPGNELAPAPVAPLP